MNNRYNLIAVFRNKIIVTAGFFILSATILYADNIPHDADKNAFAVINNYEAVFSLLDPNNATYKVSKSITIVNKQGEEYASFYIYGDKFRELKNFSGIVKDASGKVVKKIGKKDLIKFSLSEHLASDSYSMLYECKIPFFPYTVEYTYEEKWKNGIITYPSFTPVTGYMQSTEKALYTVELPVDMNLRYKANFDCEIKDERTNNKHIYTFSAKNLKAIEEEPMTPSLHEICPRVMIAPHNFCFDSYCGDMSDWKGYGTWVSKLLKDRDILSKDIAIKIKDLTKDAKDDREKTKILYEYLQNNFRYVSIQLGIGGFQPINAPSVYENKYGDCKGLSNLMKAFLKAIDIASYYCEISTKEKNLYNDFANVSQTDHVILLVPLENDSVWLECTSQKLPFGFIHNNIAGHEALIISEEGGKICRLPSYTDQQNKKVSSMTIDIDENGIARGNVSFTEYLHGYAFNSHYILSENREREIEYVNKNIKLPKILLNNIHTKETRDIYPSCMLTASFEANDFVNKTGSRLFIPVCPLNKGNYNRFSSNRREQDIVIDYGFSESDSIVINIPESYSPESLPTDITLESPFGTLKTRFIFEGTKITYIQNIEIFSGKYSKSEYDNIKSFFSKITSATIRKAVLKKSAEN